jgi:hypothetical protein
MLEVDKLAEGEELGSNVLHLQVHYRLTSGKGFGPSLLGTDGAQWGQPFIFECSCPGRTFNSCNFPTRTKPSRRSGTSPSFPTSRPATTAASTRRSEPDRPSISRQERASYGRRRVHQLAVLGSFCAKGDTRQAAFSFRRARVAAFA